MPGTLERARDLVGHAISLGNAGQLEGAAAAARKAIALLKGGDRPELLSKAYGALGVALWPTPHEAYRQFRRARLAAQRGGAACAEQLLLSMDNEALCLGMVRRADKAVALQRKALAAAERHGLDTQARTLRRRMSNFVQDQGHFRRSAELLAAAHPPRGAPVVERLGWLHANALLAERWGRYEAAERWYDQAAALYERNAAQCAGQAACLVNAAMLKVELDRRAEARRLLEVAAATAPADPPLSYYANRHVAEAMLEARNDIAAADRCMEIACRKARERNPKSPKYWLDFVGQRADMLAAAGRHDAARAVLDATLAGTPVGAEAAMRPVALQLAELMLLREGTADEAERLLRPLVGHPSTEQTEWRLLSCLADLAAARRRPEAAILLGKLAVLMTMRSVEPFPGGSFQRAEMVRRRERPFSQLMRRLVLAGRMSELARLRAALNRERAFNLASRTGRSGAEEATDLLGDAELAWVERYTALRDAALSAVDRADDPFLAKRRRAEAGAEHELARRGLLALLDEATRPGPVKSAMPLRPEAAAERTAPGTAILRFYTLADACVVEVVGTGGATRLELAASAEEIGSAVAEFLDLAGRGRPAEAAARSLYRALMLPIEPHLDRVDRLELFVDGALAALPFAALHDGEGFLAERFAFAYLSGAPPPPPPQPPAPIRDIAMFGVTRAWHGLPALRHVGDELAGAGRAFATSRRLVDGRFTARALRNALAEGHGAIHVASHYHLVPGSPDRSYLLLGDGERMPVSAFLAEDLAWSSAGLLFLSACETATPDTPLPDGETLACALHERGLGSLIASIWPVVDPSTAALVSAFYGHVAAGLGLAAALRQAQLALISGDAAPARARFDHPVHWAGFKLFAPGR